jgi:hypothetical protein
MKKIKSLMTILMFSILLTFVFNSHASAYVAYKLLSVPEYKQEQTAWCWAATSKMIIGYLKTTTPTQSAIVTTVKGSAVNSSANYTEDQSSLTSYSVATTGTSGAISFGQIITDTENYRPMKAAIAWQSTPGTGHEYVIRGYYQDTSVPTTDVYYMDPDPNQTTYKLQDYATFVSNSSFYWNWTFYTNH